MDQAGSALADRLSRIQQRVQERIGASRFRTWFGESAQFELQDDALAIHVANSFVGNWIADNYMEELVAATREVFGGEPSPVVRITQAGLAPRGARPPAGAADAADAAVVASTSPRRRSSPGQPTLRGDLDSFVVGPSNQLAVAAARTVIATLGRSFKLLVVHGGCGLGKTHLLHAICNGVRQRHPTLEWRYVSGEEFTNEYISAVKSGHIDAFRARFRTVDLLVVDDIHFLANKKATQEEFLHTYNAIDSLGKIVVLSSDRHPRAIATLSEPLINRLISGMVVSIETPDFATRREILRRRAAAMGHELSEPVFDFIAEHICQNVRELEGALYKLVAVASLTREPITLEMARNVLAEEVYRAHSVLDPEEIARVACARFGLTPAQIYSRSRDRTICLARAVAMFLVRKHTTLSFPEIGRRLGKKNHSTVLMATQRIDRQIEADDFVRWRASGTTHQMLIRALLEELEQQIKPQKR